ncbi:MAG: response regulator, partial [Atribacterota bacterium]
VNTYQDKNSIKVQKSLQQRKKEIKKKIREDRERLKVITNNSGPVENSEVLETKIIDLKLRLSELSEKYNYLHPKIINIKKQIKNAQTQLNNSYRKSKIAQMISTNKQHLNSIENKIKGMILNMDNNAVRAELVSPAAIENKPVRPDKTKRSVFGGMLGLISGITFLFWKKKKTLTLENIEHIENKTKIPVIGILPGTKGFNKLNKQTFIKLFENIKMSTVGRKGNIFHFTDIHTQNSKHSVVLNFCRICAENKVNTLLIETDNTKEISDEFSDSSSAACLNDMVTDDLEWWETIQTVNDYGGNLKIVYTSRYNNNISVNMLSSQKMKNFFNNVRRKFDIVVIDSGSVLFSAEALIWSKITDYTIVLSQQKKNEFDYFKRTKALLDKINVNILGSVLYNAKAESNLIYAMNNVNNIENEIHDSEDSNKRKKILIIDDELRIVDIISRMLIRKSKHDFEIETATDGVDALKKMDLFEPDIVVTDLKVPGISGIEICKKIRKRDKKGKIKIVAITGYSTTSARDNALECGADDFMEKPINFGKFINRVDMLAK